jgi:dolichol-phosphate mannosyltransferase
LTRNFGKEIALSAGVDVADGDAVICMDADLQHPPELISDMIEAWRRGAEVVVAVRLSIARQPLLRRMGSYLFHQLMTRFSGIDMTLGATDYRLLDRKVVRVFRNITERARMFRGIVDWMGFETERVYFHADFRREGKSSFSYGRLWQMAVTSLTSFSLVPLRLTAYLGLAITTGSGLLLARMFWARLFPGATIFTPLAIFVVANTFLMGIVLMAVGMVAFYIGTIHTEVVNRPLYIVRNRINFSGSRAAERVESVASERDA